MDEMDETQASGDCFIVASHLGTRFTPDEVIDDIPRQDIWVVHGLPVGRGKLNEGKRFWHAWVEVKHRTKVPPELVAANPAFATFGTEIVTELVIDRSQGQEWVLPKAVYYNMGDLDEEHVWRFTMDQAESRLDQFKHYGPWVDGWEGMEEV